MVGRWGASYLTGGMSPLMRHNVWFQQVQAPMLAQANSKTAVVTQMTSSAVRKRGDTKAIDWTTLTPVFIKELRLFNIHEGNVLEAKIVGRPAMQTGIQTVLQDARGDQMTASFYNCAGADVTANTPFARAQTIIEKRFPIGVTVRVANPFLKIGTGGLVTIRLDDPRELSVGSSGDTSAATSCINVSEEKEHGNSEFKKGCFEAARKIYTDALQAADLELQASMLNNRALMQLHLQEYEGAMLDAALVLVMRSGNEKAWHRYVTAAKEMGAGLYKTLGEEAEAAKQKALNRKAGGGREEQEERDRSEQPNTSADARQSGQSIAQEQRNLYERLLRKTATAWLSHVPLPVLKPRAVDFSLERADECNEKGKQFFKQKDYLAAEAAFTEGLLVLNADKSTRPLGALLGNLTTCALRTGRSVEGLALSLLTLRLFVPSVVCLSNTVTCVSGNQVGIRNKALIRVVSALVNLGESSWVKEFWHCMQASFKRGEKDLAAGMLSAESVAFLKKGYKAETTFIDFLEAQGQEKGLIGARSGPPGHDEENEDGASETSSALRKDLLQLRTLLSFLESANHATLRGCDWISPSIELRDTGVDGKGRGVFAKHAMKSGTVVMICRPDPCLVAEIDTKKMGIATTDTSGGGLLLDSSQKEIQRQVMSRLVDDLALARRLYRLYDGSKNFYDKEKRDRVQQLEREKSKGDARRESAFDIFLHCLPPFVFPALPPKPLFAPPSAVKELGTLSESQIAGILSMNEFGSGKRGLLGDGPQRTTLHVPASMFNHSIEKENTGFAGPITSPLEVLTLSKDVAAGKELFIVYTTDKDAEKKWIGDSRSCD
eukprot:g19739.t1